ncbi:MAG TPA: right-handed parallel beta-helix repeat-containing protein [Candidatus Babeliales bacterium]|nr:right-handed parallel beta-helix repeat-containing protein [Candidatus Babeliales bacterium]
MNYKNILLMSVALLSQAVCVVSASVEQDVVPNKLYELTGSRGQSWIEDAICQLTNKIDEIKCCEDLCKATVITKAEILTESGIYCLANNVTGTIVIAGSSITLNLNGYTVSAGSDGIAVAPAASDVRIRNGFVRGSGADRGIFVDGASDVRIEDVTCENWENGIYVLNGFTITCDRVACTGNCDVGLTVENSVGIIARDSTFNQNLAGALSLNGSIAEFINCSAVGQISTDVMRQREIVNQFSVDLLRKKNVMRACVDGSGQAGFVCANAESLYRDCSAFNCVVGFANEGGQVDAFNSVAESNVLGFLLNGDKSTVTNCIAENNAVAGFVSDPDQGEVVFRDCVAKANGEHGFFEYDATVTDNVNNMYLNCVSCNNGINYSANIIAANNAPVTTSAAARGFANVDCSLDEPATCAAIPVSEAQTLSLSGTYCLTNDVTGTIVITGSSITLNLNGYAVLSGSDGISIASSASDVRIKNGSVRGSGADRGIFVNGATDVRIEEVTCDNWTIGIYSLNAVTVILDNVNCNNNTTSFQCDSTEGAIARNTTFSNNSTGALVSVNSTAEFINCSAYKVLELRGQGIDDASLVGVTSKKVISENRAQPIPSAGFYCNFSSMTIYRDCSATFFDSGFVNDQGSASEHFNSVATSCDIGFELHGDKATLTNCIARDNSQAGYSSFPDVGEVIFRDCVAKDNAEYGFLEEGPISENVHNMYLNCVACNNGTNYSSNIIAANNAPVTSAAAARGFGSVDCSLDEPATCAAIPVSEAQTLSLSGTYCLTNDVTGTIVITGSSITLNLNGYAVLSGSDGISIASSASDVRIKNGSVRGSGADRGIFIDGAPSVRIEDVTCENWENGIYFANVVTGVLNNVISNNNSSSGVYCNNSVGIVIRNSIFNDNRDAGVLADNGSAVECIACSATAHIVDCLRQQQVEDSLKQRAHITCFSGQVGFESLNSTMVARSCSASTLSSGFFSSLGQNDLADCFAQGCLFGFTIGGDTSTVTNCVAEKSLDSGFLTSQDGGEAVFRECVAKDNILYGFQDAIVLTTDLPVNMYLNCVACNNGTNYSSNIVAANNAPVTSAAAARGFENVDCTLDDPAPCCSDMCPPTTPPCAATPVSEAQTLTLSGTYCLTNNVAGPINIAGDSITLDLNGYTVTGAPLKGACAAPAISVESGVRDVRIKNGLVSNAPTGICILNADFVRIEDVTCVSCDIGIDMEVGSNIVLDRVISSQNSTYGLKSSVVTGLTVRNSSFDNDGVAGVYVTQSTGNEFISCSAVGGVTGTEDSSGFDTVFSTVVFRNCFASGYTFGFQIECDSFVNIDNGIAEGCETGFLLYGLDVYLTNCTARDNNIGFYVPVECEENGRMTLRGCYASGNTGGFIDDTVVPTDTTLNMYLNCVACHNSVNYSANIIASMNAPVSAVSDATGFGNADCSIPGLHIIRKQAR